MKKLKRLTLGELGNEVPVLSRDEANGFKGGSWVDSNGETWYTTDEFADLYLNGKWTGGNVVGNGNISGGQPSNLGGTSDPTKDAYWENLFGSMVGLHTLSSGYFSTPSQGVLTGYSSGNFIIDNQYVNTTFGSVGTYNTFHDSLIKWLNGSL